MIIIQEDSPIKLSHTRRMTLEQKELLQNTWLKIKDLIYEVQERKITLDDFLSIALYELDQIQKKD